jgi:hypothetical protein
MGGAVISMGYRPPQVTTPDPVGALTKAMTLQQMAQQTLLNQQKWLRRRSWDSENDLES